jgi:putative peptidoglycan binding protein
MVFTGDGHNRVAKSLVTLYNQVVHDFPGRKTGNDGTIGDVRHQAEGASSDHNPHIHEGGMGIITALDITHDPAHGFDALAFAESLRTQKEPRIKYVIFNGRIFSSTQSPWQWRPRNLGPGDHAEHVHVSVLGDPAKYDDETPWKYSGSSNAVTGPTAAFPPKLQLGDTGPAVHDLQNLLGIEADGVFGAATDNAVRAFQASHNLFVDGVVGSHTWGVLQDSSPIKIAKPDTVVAQDALDDIVRAAANSSLAGVNWRDRGRAPIGYIKGMAATYGRVYAKWKAKDSSAVLMAAMNSGKDETDALSWYDSRFRAAGMDNSVSGAATLRHLFVLLIGLGMRESSGQYFEGRDMSAQNVAADTAEAGLFQMSWNAHSASAEIPRLFAQYSAKPDGFLSLFQEGVPARTTDNFGSGDGAAFQRLCKTCPAFAAEAAAVGLRVLRSHWGPIIRHDAEIRPEADALLQQVEKIVDAAPPIVVGPVVVGPPSRPLDLIQMLVLIVLMTLLKEKQMAGDPSKQGQADPLMVILPVLLQSLSSGKQPNFSDLVTGLLSGMAAPAPAAPAPATPAPQSTDPLATILLPLLLGRLGLSVPGIGTTPVATPAAPTTPAPATPAATDPLSVIKGLLDGLKGLVPSASSTPASTTTPDQQQLQKILDLLKAVTGGSGLGPVNGALGSTIGNMLDGKKSAIGIIGSVLSGVMAMAAPGGSAASILPTVLAGGAIPGIGQIALPIFLGMTIWGALGKMEKWNGQSK